MLGEYKHLASFPGRGRAWSPGQAPGGDGVSDSMRPKSDLEVRRVLTINGLQVDVQVGSDIRKALTVPQAF